MLSQVNYVGQNRVAPRKVFFTGSTALKSGVGVCYDADWTGSGDGEGAGDACAYRDRYVQVPSSSNNLSFAGVVAQDYDAVSGGQWITINEPGSVCMVALDYNKSRGEYTTCSASTADAGRFGLPGFVGRGTAKVLQDKTAVLDSDFDADNTTVNGTAVANTGAFSSASAGDKVVLYGSAVVTAGTYTISSVTDNDNVVLSSSASGSSGKSAMVVYSGNPKALALLLDGEESGLTQVVQPNDNATATPEELLIGGYDFVAGVNAGSGNSDADLADAAYNGQKKGIRGLASVDTNALAVDLDSSAQGLQSDASTTLASVSIDAANEEISLLSMAARWHTVVLLNATEG